MSAVGIVQETIDDRVVKGGVTDDVVPEIGGSWLVSRVHRRA